ncbi:hypothetical protein HPB48_001114 [Haemaphysalis longicornis]|uniref:Sorting nexin C-terminal domain-containing protein n=1 Tax=Haemaphysalis longicornis TaxID=44386 RepID=A0A9J6GEX1_HAELO|nr:hypothetical protein HPB48_001114 [Haemaphysalis longicornis]
MSSHSRQLREWVSWVFSESTLVYLLDTFRESLWPGGQLAPEWPRRSEQEQAAARKQAKTLLLDNLPRQCSPSPSSRLFLSFFFILCKLAYFQVGFHRPDFLGTEKGV